MDSNREPTQFDSNANVNYDKTEQRKPLPSNNKSVDTWATESNAKLKHRGSSKRVYSRFLVWFLVVLLVTSLIASIACFTWAFVWGTYNGKFGTVINQTTNIDTPDVNPTFENDVYVDFPTNSTCICNPTVICGETNSSS